MRHFPHAMPKTTPNPLALSRMPESEYGTSEQPMGPSYANLSIVAAPQGTRFFLHMVLQLPGCFTCIIISISNNTACIGAAFYTSSHNAAPHNFRNTATHTNTHTLHLFQTQIPPTGVKWSHIVQD